jgi:hypothetical protein
VLCQRALGKQGLGMSDNQFELFTKLRISVNPGGIRLLGNQVIKLELFTFSQLLVFSLLWITDVPLVVVQDLLELQVVDAFYLLILLLQADISILSDMLETRD